MYYKRKKVLSNLPKSLEKALHFSLNYDALTIQNSKMEKITYVYKDDLSVIVTCITNMYKHIEFL